MSTVKHNPVDPHLKDKHVVPNPKGGWGVRDSGAARASKIFPTQRDAVAYARAIAREQRARLYIHDIDGTIKERSSFEEGSRLRVAAAKTK
jgi:Uncharacterized protein conserved in bacteria (DUF2188)